MTTDRSGAHHSAREMPVTCISLLIARTHYSSLLATHYTYSLPVLTARYSLLILTTRTHCSYSLLVLTARYSLLVLTTRAHCSPLTARSHCPFSLLSTHTPYLLHALVIRPRYSPSLLTTHHLPLTTCYPSVPSYTRGVFQLGCNGRSYIYKYERYPDLVSLGVGSTVHLLIPLTEESPHYLGLSLSYALSPTRCLLCSVCYVLFTVSYSLSPTHCLLLTVPYSLSPMWGRFSTPASRMWRQC